MEKLGNKLYDFLRWTEKWTKTDMVYLAKGGSWLTLGRIVSMGGSLILAIIYANILPKDSYGLYKYILSTIGILGITSLPGINTSLTRSVVLGYEGSFKEAIKTKLKWSLLGSIIGLIIATYYFYKHNMILGSSFLIAALFSPFINSLIYGSYLEGKKMFKTLAVYSSINQFLMTCTIILVLIFSKNIISLIFTYYLTSLIICVILFFYTFSKNKLNNLKDPNMISFGKHLSAMSILGLFSENIDKILMWHFLGPINLAIYSFSTVPITQAQSFLKSINTLAYPKIANQNIKILKKTLPFKAFRFTIILLVPVLIYILSAPYLYKLLFPEYLESIKYSQYFAIMILLFPYRIISHPLIAQANKKALYIQQTIGPLIKIILLFILLPLYGITGAIVALLISAFINNILLYYLFQKM